MARNLQIGLIGASAERGWAKVSHVPAIQCLKGVELAAVVSTDQAKAEAAAKAFGARAAYGDAQALFSDNDVDVVTVAVKVPDHRQLVLAAIAAGKHVYCEWPLGRDVAEAEELAAAAREAGVHVAVGLQMRMNPAALRARSLIESGAIGRPLSARIVSTTVAFGSKVEAAMAFAETGENGATLVTIQGAHTTDLAIAVLGELEAAAALATTQYPLVEVGSDLVQQVRSIPDHIFILARLVNGAPLSIEVAGGRPVKATPFRFEITGEKGTIVLDGGAPRGFQSGRLRLQLNGDEQQVEEGETAGLPETAANVAGIYAALRDDIANGTATAPNFDHAVCLTRMIRDLQSSSRTGARKAALNWPTKGDFDPAATGPVMRKHSAPSKVRMPLPAEEPASGSEPHDGLPPGPRLRAMVSMLTALAMATIDTAIANTALPTIAKDLGVDPGASVWIVTIYQLACVAALMPLASLGEIVGQRRIHISGLVLFTIASLLAACAWSLPSLVVARTLQGLGASALMAANVALIRSIYPANRLGSGIGLNAFVVGVSFAIGPTVASLILFMAPWPWLFAINVPIGLVGLGLAWISLPETARSDERFDRLAALLTAGLFSLFVLGLGEVAHTGPSLWVAAEWVGSATCGIILLRRQAGHAAPMIATDLLRRPLFALSAAASVCAFSAQGLAFVSLPFLLQHGLGHSQVETGFLMTPWPVVVAAMAPVAGYLSDRYAPGPFGGIGLAALCIGMVLLATLPASPSIIGIVWRMALCGAGFGFFQAPNVRAFMTSAPPARSGSASGMASLVRLLGQTTGAALVAACFAFANTNGPTFALYLGSGFAAVAAAVSIMRVRRRSDAAKTDTDA